MYFLKIIEHKPHIMKRVLVIIIYILATGAAFAQHDSSLPAPRFQPCMTYDNTSESVLVFGGMNLPGTNLNDMWLYKGPGWHKLSIATPSARNATDMAYDASRNKTVLFGGMGPSGELADTWEYDGHRWTRIETSIAPSSRGGHQMAYDAVNKRVVLHGGVSNKSKITYNDTWSWNGKTWTKLSEEGPARFHHTMDYNTGTGRIMMFGGNSAQPPLNFEKFMSSQSAEVWEFDGAKWIRLQVDAGPSARDHQAMAFDIDRNVFVMFGGFNRDEKYLADTWEWDGRRWTRKEPATRPEVRGGKPGMVYSRKHKGILLFGGGIGGGTELKPKAMNDMWLWDGKDWKRLQ